MKIYDAWEQLKKTLNEDSKRDYGHGYEVNVLLQTYAKATVEYLEDLERIFE